MKSFEGYYTEKVSLKTTGEIPALRARLESLDADQRVMMPLDGFWVSRDEAMAYVDSKDFRDEVATYEEEGEAYGFEMAIEEREREISSLIEVGRIDEAEEAIRRRILSCAPSALGDTLADVSRQTGEVGYTYGPEGI